MKKEYERASIEFIMTDACDIITSSDNPDSPIVGTGPIGGGGYDPNGWT